MDKKIQPYILPVVLLIAGLALGSLIGKNISGVKPTNETKVDMNKLYSSQTATIRGQITAVDGNNLTVKSLNSNDSGTVKASISVIIAKFSQDPKKVSSPSSDLSTIELNKDVLINLEMVDGQYEATVIQYVVPGPKIPPASKP